MGKIRVKTLGDEELEQKQKKEAKKRAEVKKVVKETPLEVVKETQGTKGTNASVSSGSSVPFVSSSNVPSSTSIKETKVKEKKTDNQKPTRSRTYQTVAQLVDKNKKYSLKDALTLLEKLKRAKFDETVELHINTLEAGISGSLTLPHGTGKQLRVVIADEKLIADVEKGKIDFDILLATPQMMPKLAKVARVLGPKGLMPNPKSGTVTQNPEEAAKKFAGGQVNYKTEAKLPLLHLTVGKVSFGQDKLAENIKTVFKAITADKIKNITLKSTMSPGIKIQI